jgi:hypothetical protein
LGTAPSRPRMIGPPSQSSPPPPFASRRMPATMVGTFPSRMTTIGTVFQCHGSSAGCSRRRRAARRVPAASSPSANSSAPRANPPLSWRKYEDRQQNERHQQGQGFQRPQRQHLRLHNRWQVDRDRHEQKSRQACRRASRRHEKVVPGDRVVVQSTSLTDPADSEAIPTRRRSRRRLGPRWAYRTPTPLLVLLE